MNKATFIVIFLLLLNIGINLGSFYIIENSKSNNNTTSVDMLEEQYTLPRINCNCETLEKENKGSLLINNTKTENINNIQNVYVKALGIGRYDKTEIKVKNNLPVKFHFSAEKNAGCGKVLYIDDFNVKLTSYNEEETSAVFTPTKKGTYYYHCGMWMFVGKLIVE